jgi:Protein of unknown function (DUF2459)
MTKLRLRWRTFCFAASLVAAPYPSPGQSSFAQASPAQSPVGQSRAAQSRAAPFLPAPQASAVIYVARRGWHVDVGFAAADLEPPLKTLLAEFPGAQYLFFGFGDRRYLLARNRNAPVLLAAVWPGRGMILATGLVSPPSAAFGTSHVVALAVTARQASDAQAFVWYSLDRQPVLNQQTTDDPVRSYAPGPYEGSLFFTAAPRYSGFHTCNTWAAEVLAATALPIHSAGVIFAGQLWRQVRRLEKKQSAIAQPTASTRPTAIARSAAIAPGASLPSIAQPLAQQGGLLPSWQTTVVPEF